MGESDIKHQLHLLQKEVEASVSLVEDVKLNLFSAIDALKIEIEVLKKFLEQYHPGFARRYPELREEVMQHLDPEWLEAGKREDKTGSERER